MPGIEKALRVLFWGIAGRNILEREGNRYPQSFHARSRDIGAKAFAGKSHNWHNDRKSAIQIKSMADFLGSRTKRVSPL